MTSGFFLGEILIFICVCLCVCVRTRTRVRVHEHHMCAVYLKGQEGVSDVLESNSCELPNVDAGNQIWYLWKNNKCSLALSHLSSPIPVSSKEHNNNINQVLKLSSSRASGKRMTGL